MIVFDATALIAHLSPTDPHHAEATSLLGAAGGQELAIHPVTLAEVLVGGCRVGRGEELLADIEELGMPPLRPQADEPLRVADLRARTRLKLPDCYPLQAALDHHAQLATFDARLRHTARQESVPLFSPGH